MKIRNKSTRLPSAKILLMGGASLSMLMASPSVLAQQVPDDDAVVQVPQEGTSSGEDEVVTTGIRRVIQDSIALKREATTVVDGLTSDDIGEIPALSIAEALEQITSVGSQREGSGATEVSIRGLGPFLGSTVINGREATNGSGDRSVNFSQFPSELFNKIEVHKTQSAELIEGGVAGQIALSTLKPLDFGKRRIQLQAKGSANVDNLRLNDPEQTLGYRLTGSYVDQWDGAAGEFGISIGGQIQVRPNPEQESRTGGPDACVIAANVGTPDEVGVDGSGCDSTGFNAEAQDINPVTGVRFGLTDPFILTSSSGAFRQNITDDNRDSIFAAAQWRPNDRVEFNIDGQYSDRVFTEFRSDLIVDRNDIEEAITGTFLPIDGFATTFTDSGAFRTATTSATIEVNSQFSERLEEYIGIGGSASFDVTDNLNFYLDASYSDTSRRENQVQARVRTGGNVIAGVEALGEDSDAFRFTVLNTDVNDPTIFDNDDPRVREDLNQFRNNTISALKGDLTYDTPNGFFKTFKAGGRYSLLEYDQLPRVRNEFEADNNDSNGDPEFLEFATEINGIATTMDNIGVLAATACANEVFPEEDFLNGEVSGNLITNIDSDGNVLEDGTGRTFLTFDRQCLAETLLGRESIIPLASDAAGTALIQSVDIREETIAGYVQADFDADFEGLPIRGNIGVRVVDTTVNSDSFRTDLVAVVNDDGTFGGFVDDNVNLETIESEFNYTAVLPSFNFAADVNDDVLFRGGVFRALSRPDPADLGAGRIFSTQSNDDTTEDTSISEVIANITATGNPFLEPFLSWNFDAAVEWYPNEDSIFAVGAYYKIFNGGFQNTLQDEEFVVNGETFTETVELSATSDETSVIFGIETTLAHAFTYLPGIWSGLGFNASYNYADSNFEIEDSLFGEAVTVDEDGNVTETLGGFVPPANLGGLSRHTANGRVYWKVGKATITGIGKYRSSFFQPFVDNGADLRFIDGAFVADARLSYNINSNLKLSIEGTNILNTARRQFRSVPDNFGEINVFGPRYFVGVTAKF